MLEGTEEIGNNKGKQIPIGDCVEISNTEGNLDNSCTHYHYENGKCIYTDPKTKRQMEWSEEEKEWVPIASLQNPPNGDYVIEGDTYVYTDKSNGIKYKWNKEKNEWVKFEDNNEKEENKSGETKEARKVEKKEDDEEEESEDEEGNVKKKEIKCQDMTKGHYGFENDTHTYTDDTDGTVYEWDKEKNAWFPRVDEDFLAQYQLNYGFATSTEEKKEDEKPESEEKKKTENEGSNLKRKLPQQPSWFEVNPENNTKVYVTNLPTDITEEEFVDLMQKCGLVMKDIDTGKMKVKLYTDPGTNTLKGDALCTYIKVESVELALKILDGYEIKGKKISVERAKFQMKGDSYDPSLKPKKRRRKEKEKIKKMQEKLFDWHPEKLRGQRSKSDRVVIVKNLFDPSIFDKDVGLILEYQQDLREECSKCGDVRKVTIYDRHPEGVAQINFKEAEAADACVQLLNNRWFGQRKITAETWDGKTKFKIAETEAEIQQRLNKWDSFLEDKKAEEKEAIKRDSDQNTRSSGGSDYDTDEETVKDKDHST